MKHDDNIASQQMDVASIEREAREMRALFLRDLVQRGIARVVQWLRPNAAAQH
jgi:hypothetical protein